MAVHDLGLRPYTGQWTEPRWRFLVVTRYALGDAFRSRLATIVFTAAFALPIGGAVFIYLRYNFQVLEAMGVRFSEMGHVDSVFFLFLMSWQSFVFGGLLALLIGPGLISSDLVNNALPLYLSRSLPKSRYVVGKLAVLVLLLSAITWVPGLLLFGLQAVLAGGEWTVAHLHLPVAIVTGSLLWILVLSLMALAASALTRRKVAAQSLLVGAVLGGAWIGEAVQGIFRTSWGQVFNLGELMRGLLAGLYRVRFHIPVTRDVLPPVAPYIVLPLLCGACILVLARRLKAKDVVR